MSSENPVAQNRSAHINRRTLVRSLAALAAPAIGAGLLVNTALAGSKKAKRKHRKSGKGGASAQCGGGCK